MSSFWARYVRLLDTSPIISRTVTSSLLFGAGDLMTQKFAPQTGPDSSSHIDYARLANMMTWGGMFAPLAYGWYLMLQRWLPGNGAVDVVKKVVVDQLTWTPVINSMFFFTTTFMKTGNVSESTKSLEKLPETLKVNWVVWPGIQLINFAYVPEKYRLLYVNVASLFWSAFLSYRAYLQPPKEVSPLV